MESGIWKGVGDWLTDIACVLEQVAFFQVVDLMLPLLEAQQEQQRQLKKFVYHGLESSAELIDAVYAQNPFLSPA